MPQKTDSKGNLVDKTEADLSYIEKLKLNEQIKIQAQYELKLAADLASLYNFIFRRCTKFLQDKIKAHSRYTAVDDASDPLGLLSIIREIVHKIESSAYLPFYRPKRRDGATNPTNNNNNNNSKPKAQPAEKTPNTLHDKDGGMGVSLYTDKKKGDDTKEASDGTDSTISTKMTGKSTKTPAKKTGSMIVTIAEATNTGQEDLHEFSFTTTQRYGITKPDMGRDGVIPKTWILLDNQSTVNVFCNAELLSDIREVDITLTIYSNAGSSDTRWMGTLRGFGDVWFDPNGIANIVNFGDAEDRGFDITNDTRNGSAFYVTNPTTGTVRIFRRSADGLYYSDTATDAGGLCLTTTVEDKKI
jgi:hypothetical protein